MIVVNRYIFLVMVLQLFWSLCLGRELLQLPGLEKQAEVNCHSPQYLEMGTTSTINCLCHVRVFALFWYNTTDFTQREPIIHHQNTFTSGTGDSLDHYDIDENGQLIIKNVSIEHERTFTLAYMYSQNELPTPIYVQVIVFAKSSTPFPVLCGKGSNKCYSEVEQSLIRCSVFNARPAVELTLASRTLNGDRNISNEMVITKEGISYTSRVTPKDEFRHSSPLNLVVCKAFPLPGILEENESLMLAKIGKIDFSNRIPSRIYVERYNKIELSCTHSYASFGVWEKGSSLEDEKLELLMYFVLIGEGFEGTFSRDVTLGSNGSLIIPTADLSHEGLYFCIYGDGMTDDVTLYEVVVTVRPIPNYPIIEGCTLQQYCVLEKQHEGNLICTVQGIRPKLHLEWRTSLDSDTHSIVFTNRQSAIKEDGGTFTIKVNGTYLIKDKSLNRMTVQCSVISSEQGLHMSTKMDLVFRKGVNTPKDALIAYSLVVTVIILVVLIWICRRGTFLPGETTGRGDEPAEGRNSLRGANSVTEGSSGTTSV